jgi:hypothetical protein
VTPSSFCALALVFALAAPNLGAAQSLCDGVAEAERTAAARSSGTGQWRPGGSIVTGPLELHETVGTIVEHVRSRYRVAPSLSDALARIASFGTGGARTSPASGRPRPDCT